MWLIILLDQLPIVDLVSRYLTNYLMGRELILRRVAPCEVPRFSHIPCRDVGLFGISSPFGLLFRS